MAGLKSEVSMFVIKSVRRVFYNTPIQRWKITSFLYDKIFHFGFNTKDLNTHYFGVDLMFPGRDFTITPGLIGGFYEKSELTIFEAICSASKRVIDVGGNIGLYACVAGANGCVVEVFEPVPENQEYLLHNVRANNLTKRVRIHKLAVGEKNKTAKINLSRQNIGTHSLAEVKETSGAIVVKVIALDTFLNPKQVYDVLKIDVEGYDGFVLDGARKLLKKTTPTLFIELVPERLEVAKYSPQKFIKTIVNLYPYIYCVDDVNSLCFMVTHDQLLEYVEANKNINLIATSNLDHKAIIDGSAR